MKRGTLEKGGSDVKKQNTGPDSNESKTFTIRNIISLQTLSGDILSTIASFLTSADLVACAKVVEVFCRSATCTAFGAFGL